MADLIDTGLRTPFRVYWFKWLHPLFRRWGRYLLWARQRRRYFVMAGDYVSDYTAKFGSFEAEEIALARHACRVTLGAKRMARGALVDIGCHIGNYSVELGGDFGAVLAVDAMASYVHITRANLAWNRLDAKACVMHCAVSDHEGEAHLAFQRSGNLGHAHLSTHVQGEAAGVEMIDVEAATLDTLVGRAGLSEVAYIKIDVEGHEAAVLRGAAQTITSAQPLIQVEIDQGHLPAVMDLLREMNVDYQAWQVARGDPRQHGFLPRLWTALRSGGNPLFLRQLDPHTPNPRHLPCVLLLPGAIDPYRLQVPA